MLVAVAKILLVTTASVVHGSGEPSLDLHLSCKDQSTFLPASSRWTELESQFQIAIKAIKRKHCHEQILRFYSPPSRQKHFCRKTSVFNSTPRRDIIPLRLLHRQGNHARLLQVPPGGYQQEETAEEEDAHEESFRLQSVNDSDDDDENDKDAANSAEVPASSKLLPLYDEHQQQQQQPPQGGSPQLHPDHLQQDLQHNPYYRLEDQFRLNSQQQQHDQQQFHQQHHHQHQQYHPHHGNLPPPPPEHWNYPPPPDQQQRQQQQPRQRPPPNYQLQQQQQGPPLHYHHQQQQQRYPQQHTAPMRQVPPRYVHDSEQQRRQHQNYHAEQAQQEQQRPYPLPKIDAKSGTTPSYTMGMHGTGSAKKQVLSKAPPLGSSGVAPGLASPAADIMEEAHQFDKDMIFEGLKKLYKKKIRPLEMASKYAHFFSPPLGPSDFDAKPMVLLLGQYSVGKTSFIKYLLGHDFPGSRIGPEPTTDRFTTLFLGDPPKGGRQQQSKVIPGAALCSQADRPFRGLSVFGNSFLSRFEGVEIYEEDHDLSTSPLGGEGSILRNITLVDTPGILSGQKQQIGRNYDYEQVMKWFAERADLIIIMFDAHKLDISDELKNVIELLIPHQDKIRVVLNKADMVSTQQLMRVYGALMWSLGKVMMTPEVCRVYMGSFWDAPMANTEQVDLLQQEKMDLFGDIARLPQNAVMRRINELVKRARSVKVHAYIIHYLRKQLPYTFGKREKQRRLIDRLEKEFLMCARRYDLPLGDFPKVGPFRQALLEIKDLSEFPKLDKKMVREMDKVFSVDIPELLARAREGG